MKVIYNPILNRMEHPRTRDPIPRAEAIAKATMITDARTGRDRTKEFLDKETEGPNEVLRPPKLRPCRLCHTLSHNYFYCSPLCLDRAYTKGTSLE